jgi:hypothetical protein
MPSGRSGFRFGSHGTTDLISSIEDTKRSVVSRVTTRVALSTVEMVDGVYWAAND